MKAYAKSIAAFLTALGTWGTTSLAEGGITGAEWFGIAGVAAATLLVWAIPNQG